jgi:hypothetical protein
MDQALAASFISVFIALTLYLATSLLERRVVRHYT